MHMPNRIRRQRGALMIAFLLMLATLLGFAGLALDLGQVYNRRTELQNVADSAALAAAAVLSGSAAGIEAAVVQARTAAESRKYAYVQPVTWDDAAISFSSAPDSADGAWLDKDSAAAAAVVAGMLFVKVDTRQLAAAQGLVDTAFMHILSPGLASVATYGRAVAGRSAIQVTPLGICALSAAPRASLAHTVGAELVEYGFRRGVGYNLRALSSAGATPLNFLIDPLDPSGTGSANFATSVVAPFVCSGTMAMTRLPLPPATVHVQYPFPAALSSQLNARFNVYGGTDACNEIAAPPSNNVKEYLPTGPVWWASTPTGKTAAGVVSADGRLVTVADQPGVAAPNAGSYGVLWSYAMAAQYAAAEPAGGYLPFVKGNWPALYPVSTAPAPQVSLAYPAAPKTPYVQGGASFSATPSAPANTGVRQRRLLNIPLLSCPDAAGANTAASVLAVGQFFMTARADAASISGEFAGVVAQETLGTAVRLYQ